MQQQIEWRRSKVMELLSKGENNQSEIARVLQADRSIISRDIAHILDNNLGIISEDTLTNGCQKSTRNVLLD
jgi:predicted transcriptional regulator